MTHILTSGTLVEPAAAGDYTPDFTTADTDGEDMQARLSTAATNPLTSTPGSARFFRVLPEDLLS